MWPFSRKRTVDTSFSAALLIDMQTRFVADLDQKTRDILIRTQIAMIRYCAEKDIPLIVLEYVNEGATIPELQVEIANVPRKVVVVKSFDGGFIGTKLSKVLRGFKAKSLLLMGINASCCVLETARGARRRWYRIITAIDLIADHPGLDTEESDGWYMRNGILRATVKTLIPDIQIPAQTD